MQSLSLSLSLSLSRLCLLRQRRFNSTRGKRYFFPLSFLFPFNGIITVSLSLSRCSIIHPFLSFEKFKFSNIEILLRIIQEYAREKELEVETRYFSREIITRVLASNPVVNAMPISCTHTFKMILAVQQGERYANRITQGANICVLYIYTPLTMRT